MPTKIRLAVGAVALVGSGLLIGTAVTGGGATAADGSGTTPSATDTPPADGGRGGHEHTDVTGDELAKVTAAVEAHDATITVESVRKDPDGSYDVDGTQDDQPITLDVSKDLTTFTERTGGPGGGHGGGPGGGGDGRGGSQDTPVTGAELTKVTDAVTAYDATITVESVRKDPDGSYDVFGTQDDQPVALEVSADLKTITERTGGPGGPGEHGPGGHGGPGGPGGSRGDDSTDSGTDGSTDSGSDSAPSAGSSATPSSYRNA